MDKFLGNIRWNDLNPDEQDLIVFTLQAAAKLRLVRPDMLTKEELDDIARFVRFAQRRKATQGREKEGRHG
jgi:hypothetical protein